MFGMAFWDKLFEHIFEKFEILEILKNHKDIITKIVLTKHVITSPSYQTNKHFLPNLISFNSVNYKSASGQ